jgi:hypothetical protein
VSKGCKLSGIYSMLITNSANWFSSPCVTTIRYIPDSGKPDPRGKEYYEKNMQSGVFARLQVGDVL